MDGLSKVLPQPLYFGSENLFAWEVALCNVDVYFLFRERRERDRGREEREGSEREKRRGEESRMEATLERSAPKYQTVYPHLF